MQVHKRLTAYQINALNKKAKGIMKTFMFHFDIGLKLRTMLDGLNKNTIEFQATYNKMLDHEIRCQELDERLNTVFQTLRLNYYEKARK